MRILFYLFLISFYCHAIPSRIDPVSAYLIVDLQQSWLVNRSVLNHNDRYFLLNENAKHHFATSELLVNFYEPKEGIWIDTIYFRGSLEDVNDKDTFDFKISQSLVGATIEKSLITESGIFSGYSYAEKDSSNDSDRDEKLDMVHAGFYINHWNDAINYSFTLSYSAGDNHMRDSFTIDDIGFDQDLKVDIDSIQTGVRITTFIAENIAISNEVQNNFTNLRTKETNQANNQSQRNKENIYAISSSYTVELYRVFYSEELKRAFIPSIYYGYEYNWKEENYDVEVKAINQTIERDSVEEHGHIFGTRLQTTLTEQLQLNAFWEFKDYTDGREYSYGLSLNFMQTF
ncbi:MAG: autotransporter domain-containing protein [Lentisphaeria bacterium]|nr:autotransporter domain-containing protein [Lentisphaeria bacterium]